MKVEDDVKDIRNAMKKVFTKFGIREVDANVLAEIIILDRETSVDELSKRLGYSISGITSSMHRLMKMHLVIRDKVGKKYVYKTESNLLSALLHLIEDLRTHEIPYLKKKIERKLLENDDKRMRELKEKVEKASEYLEIVRNVLTEYGGGDKNEDSSHI